MARRILPWPSSPVDHLVKAWADRHGIDMARDVMGYDLHRGPGDVPTITLKMLFDDEPTTEPLKLVGESGPEPVSKTDKKEEE